MKQSLRIEATNPQQTMQGHLEQTSSSLIRGWFAPNTEAFLIVDNQVFPIRNGSRRPDLPARGLPIDGGFELTLNDNPDLFQFISSRRTSPITIKLFGDRDLQQPLEPVNGLILTPRPHLRQPSINDIASINGLEAPRLEMAKAKFRSDGYLVLSEFFTRHEVDTYSDYYSYLWSNRSSVKASIDLIDPRKGDELKRFEDASISDRQGPYKLNDLFLSD